MTEVVFKDLTPLLSPRSIAVVGASERAGSAGRLVMENLIQLGYPGEIYPIHPKHERVMGYPCYPSLSETPKPADCAAIVLGADKVMPTLEEAVKSGTNAAWVLAAGYSEAGPEGKVRQQELIAFAEKTGMLINGPNCVGVFNMVDKSATYSVAIGPNTKPGAVSAVMQSGAIAMGLANSARFGFRYMISSGNEAVLDKSDYIAYLAGDPETKVIIAFMESIRKPEKFIAAVEKTMQAGKPLLVVKVGRSEAAQRAVQAHTGSLAGSDVVLDAVFEKYGVVRFDDLDEMVEATELFLNCDLPENEGVALLSLSGGQIGLVSDLAENLGLDFPKFSENATEAISKVLPPYSNIGNPLDAWGSGDLEKMYPGCVEAVSKEDNIGLLAVSRDTPPNVADREIVQSLEIAKAMVKATKETGKPSLVFSNYSSGFRPEVEKALKEGGVPYLQGTKETLRAIQAFEHYAKFRREQKQQEPGGIASPPNVDEWRKRLKEVNGSLSEVEARSLLAAYGIPGPKENVARTEEEALQLAADLGFPVVLKILSPDIQHKTEIGGVRVGLQDAEAVSIAFKEVMAAAKEHHPDATIDGVLLQEMIPSDAVEVILGVVKDADFGPVVVFGSGGILVELVKDSALQLPPINQKQARELISKTRGERLLMGFRGRPAADIDALVDTLVRLSQLAVDMGDLIAALDINPLMVLPKGKGVRAVDALIEVQSS